MCAFESCVSLVDFHFQEGLKNIGRAAFAHCKALSAIALPSSLEVIGSSAFFDCTSLLGVEIPSGTKGIKIGDRCFYCESLVTVSIPNDDSVNDITSLAFSGRVLLQDDDAKTRSRDRWTRFPIHKLCYHTSRTTVKELAETIDSCETLEASLEDTFGMTPFHIVSTSSKPRVDIVQCLLDRYPLMALEHTDKYGKTMMDYLLVNGSSKAIPLMHATLQRAIVDRVFGWSPVWNERFDLSRDIRLMIRSDIDIKERREEVLELLEHAGQCIRKETTSLMELALWKMKMDDVTKIMVDSANDISYRESCRLQCGTDIVVDNVIEYLFASESTCSTALSVYPLCSLTSLKK